MNSIPNASNPKPRTQAQIEAARLNGAKSRGPATPEGKSISSQNALRHGLLSKMVVIEGESETSFQDLAASRRQSFAPPDDLDFDEHENILLDTMVLSAWRRLRAVAMESAAITLEMKSQEENYPDDPSTTATATATFHAFTSLTANTPSFDLILRYETRHTRAYERAAKALRDHRAARLAAHQAACETNPTPPEPAATVPATPVPVPTTTPPPEPATQPTQPNEPKPAYTPPLNKRQAKLLRQAKRRKNRPSPSPRP